MISFHPQPYAGPVPDQLKGPSQYYTKPSTKTYDDYGRYTPPKHPGDPYGQRESRQSHVQDLENKIRSLEMQYNVSQFPMFRISYNVH